MIYERIKELCRKNGISISFLEKKLGIAKGSLCKIDKHNPTSEKLQSISNYFDVDTDYLLNGEKIYTNEDWEIDLKLSSMDNRLKEYALKLFNLSKDKQEHVMELIDFLK